jgi:hypothetical protein
MLPKYRDVAYILQTIEQRFNPVCLVFLRRHRRGDTNSIVIDFSGERAYTNSLAFENPKDSRKQSLSLFCNDMKRPSHGWLFFLGDLSEIKKPPTATGGGCWLLARKKSYVPTPPAKRAIRMRTISMLACEH